MPEVSKKIAVRVVAVLALLIASGLHAESTAPPIISKIAVEDGTFREVTNTGTVNALNRIFYSAQMPASVKALPMTEILGGAAHAGSLILTTLVDGDWFFALDPDTGDPIAVQFSAADFVLPGTSTGFSKWSIPT